MTIVIKVKCPITHAIGVKEAIAMDLEKYGDVRVLEVLEETGEQMKLEGT